MDKAIFQGGEQTTYDFSNGQEIGNIVVKSIGIYGEEPRERWDLIITDKERIDYGAYVQNKFYLSNGEECSIYKFECRYTDDSGEEKTEKVDLIDSVGLKIERTGKEH